MNFIEAHMIVHNYADALARGSDKRALVFRPKSYLNGLTDDEICNAFKIFFAHMICFDSRTQEEYEQYATALRSLKYFVDDDIYNDVIRCTNLGTNVVFEKYGKMVGQLDNAKVDEVEQYFIDYMSARTEIIEAYKAGKLNINDALLSIVVNAYEFAGLEYKDEYKHYFLTFDDMRKNIDKAPYSKYRMYILNNR